MVWFVDDTYSTIQLNFNTPLPDLLVKAQVAAQDWCDLLVASGGSLEPSNCKFHALAYSFTEEGESPYMTPNDKENMTVVKDGSSGVIDSFEALASPLTSALHTRMLQSTNVTGTTADSLRCHCQECSSRSQSDLEFPRLISMVDSILGWFPWAARLIPLVDSVG
jgi:hypothetical protein